MVYADNCIILPRPYTYLKFCHKYRQGVLAHPDANNNLYHDVVCSSSNCCFVYVHLLHSRASAAVTNLDRLHEMKKRGPVPCSLFLNQILSGSETFMSDKKHDKIPKDKLTQYLGKVSVEFYTLIFAQR